MSDFTSMSFADFTCSLKLTESFFFNAAFAASLNLFAAEPFSMDITLIGVAMG